MTIGYRTLNALKFTAIQALLFPDFFTLLPFSFLSLTSCHSSFLLLLVIHFSPITQSPQCSVSSHPSLLPHHQLLKSEGFASLSLIELKQAVAARGMSSYGPRRQLEALLDEWLDLSLNLKVPTAMLILSRVYRLLPHQVRVLILLLFIFRVVHLCFCDR